MLYRRNGFSELILLFCLIDPHRPHPIWQNNCTVYHTTDENSTKIKWIIALKGVKYGLKHSVSPKSQCFNFTRRLPLGRREDKGSDPTLYSPKLSVKRPLLLQRTQLAKAKCTVRSLLWSLAPGSFFQSEVPLSCC